MLPETAQIQEYLVKHFLLLATCLPGYPGYYVQQFVRVRWTGFYPGEEGIPLEILSALKMMVLGAQAELR